MNIDRIDRIEEEENREKEYESLFLKVPYDALPARFGKSIYIRKEYHDRISQIVHVMGDSDITLTEYIDNVLAHHFRNYEEDIIKSFNEKVLFK